MSSDANNLNASNPGVAPVQAVRRYRYADDSSPRTSATAAVVEMSAPALASGLPIAWKPIWGALLAAGLILTLFYFSALQTLWLRWESDAGWSHGFVVPLIGLYFIRLKWDTLSRLMPKGSWVGLAVLAIGVIGQISFRATGVMHMSMLSIVTSLYGIVLFVFGWEYLKVLWLPVGYLVFAIPPPDRLYVEITTPMQMLAAESGVHLLPLFGIDAIRTGTVMHLTGNGKSLPLNVAEACSGMRMLVAFFALAVALAYSTPRPVWQKLTLAFCALPIAILCNALRVTGTGVLAIYVHENMAKGSAHEYFGLLMLGPALLMQLGVAWVLDKMFVDDVEGEVR